MRRAGAFEHIMVLVTILATGWMVEQHYWAGAATAALFVISASIVLAAQDIIAEIRDLKPRG